MTKLQIALIARDATVATTLGILANTVWPDLEAPLRVGAWMFGWFLSAVGRMLSTCVKVATRGGDTDARVALIGWRIGSTGARGLVCLLVALDALTRAVELVRHL